MFGYYLCRSLWTAFLTFSILNVYLFLVDCKIFDNVNDQFSSSTAMNILQYVKVYSKIPHLLRCVKYNLQIYLVLHIFANSFSIFEKASTISGSKCVLVSDTILLTASSCDKASL
mgnify:CR=1 FL=1